MRTNDDTNVNPLPTIELSDSITSDSMDIFYGYDPNDVTWNPDMTQDQESSYYEDIDESVNAVIAITATSHDGEPQTIGEALSGSDTGGKLLKMNIDHLKRIRLGV